MKKLILLAALFVMLLSACQGTPASTQAPTTAPANPDAQTSGGAYPSINTIIPYPVSETDANLNRGEFNLTKVEMKPSPTTPALTDIWVTGELPTSCNMLRVTAAPPDANNKIVIDVYTVAEKDAACAQAVMPFEGVVASLGGYSAGTYTIEVNGKSAGSMTVK